MTHYSAIFGQISLCQYICMPVCSFRLLSNEQLSDLTTIPRLHSALCRFYDVVSYFLHRYWNYFPSSSLLVLQNRLTVISLVHTFQTLTHCLLLFLQFCIFSFSDPLLSVLTFGDHLIYLESCRPRRGNCFWYGYLNTSFTSCAIYLCFERFYMWIIEQNKRRLTHHHCLWLRW